MKFFSYFIAIVLYTSAFADIHQIDHFREANEYIEDLDEHSLVIFDVDGVLLITTEPFLHPKNTKKYSDALSPLFSDLSPREKDFFIGLYASASKKEILVDQDACSFIEQIRATRAKLMALTALPSGKIGNLQNLSTWRYNRLKSHQIDFSDTFDRDDFFVLKHLPPNLESYPTYYKGILFSNGIGITSKGEVLVAFLQKMDYTPKMVVFFDDYLLNLESVSDALEQFFPNTEYIGFHYHGVFFTDAPECSEEEIFRKTSELISEAKNSCIAK